MANVIVERLGDDFRADARRVTHGDSVKLWSGHEVTLVGTLVNVNG